MPATDAEYEEINRDLEELREELKVLYKVGTNRGRVEELLMIANNALEDGDYRRARLSIDKAQSTARTATENFLKNWIIEVRNILLAARTKGADISISRPLLITAKKALNSKNYRKTAGLTFNTVDTMGGVSDEYRDTLRKLMKAYYNYTLVESLGIDMTPARDHMDEARAELSKGDYSKAIEHADNAKREVRRLNKTYRETSLLLVDALDTIRRGEKEGTDVSDAKRIVEDATDLIERNEFDAAQALLKHAIDEADEAVADMEDDPSLTALSERLDKVREQIEFAERIGMDTTGFRKMEGRAERAMGQGDFEKADDYIDRTLEDLPKMTASYINGRFNNAGSRLFAVQEAGLDVEGLVVQMNEAIIAGNDGDLKCAVNLLDSIEPQLDTLMGGGTNEGAVDEPEESVLEDEEPAEEVEDIRVLVEEKRRMAMEAIDRGKGMGADLTDADLFFSTGWMRQEEGELEKALVYYSRAIDAAIEAGKALAWKGDG